MRALADVFRRPLLGILDWIAGEVSDVRKELGSSDRGRLDKYLEDIRELERRIQAVEKRNSTGDVRELPEARDRLRGRHADRRAHTHPDPHELRHHMRDEMRRMKRMRRGMRGGTGLARRRPSR